MINLQIPTEALDSFFLYYFFIINFVYFILVTIGTFKVLFRSIVIREENISSIKQSISLPYITFVLPAYNEEKNILSAISNLKDLTYPYKQVIVVNDGSKDKTLEILKKELELFSIPKSYENTLPTEEVREVFLSRSDQEFMVIDKRNGGGKFDALNAGINAAKSPYFLVMDADTIIDDESFLNIVRPTLEYEDTIAVGATIKILNGCSMVNHKISTLKFPQNILSLMQNFEYLRSFIERQGWDYLGGNFVLSGAFGIFRKDEVIKVGGYSNTVAEDMEIIIRLHRVMKGCNIPYKIFYLPDPVAWTKGPETIRSLAKQRMKWQKGILDSLWFHKKALLRPKNGIFSVFSYPFMIMAEGIEPIVELAGVIYIILGFFLGIVKIHFVMIFLIVTLGFNILFTAHCILAEEFYFRRYTSFRTTVYFVIFNVIEKLGYRQADLLWRVKGCFDFIKDIKRVHKESKAISSLIKKATKGKIS